MKALGLNLGMAPATMASVLESGATELLGSHLVVEVVLELGEEEVVVR